METTWFLNVFERISTLSQADFDTDRSVETTWNKVLNACVI